MASTYSTNLALELIGSGDQAGSWGNTTNTNLGTLIEQAISGYVTQAVSTGTDTTITIPNGSTGVARNMYIELTGTGGTNTNLIVPANKKLYFIFNNSTGAVTVKVSGQTGVSVPAAAKMGLVCNGTDVVNAVTYFAALSSASLTLSGNLTLSGGTANGVLYLNGSKAATSGSALTFDGTRMAVGTTPSATDTLLVYSSSAAAVFNVVGDGQSSNLNASRYSADTGSPFGIFYKARGTYASPAAVNTGDAAGQISFQVYGGSNFRDIARIAAVTETYTSDTNISGYLSFRTNSGSTGSSEKMRLDSSGNLGIGTSSPGAKLDVSGGDALVYGVRVGRGAGAAATNTAVGASALAANTTGSNNTAVGSLALDVNTTGVANTGIGSQALGSSVTANHQTALGYHALRLATGGANTAVGSQALESTTSGTENVAIGFTALIANTTGAVNTAVGTGALQSNTTGSNNVAVGYQSLYANTNSNVTAIGFQAGVSNTSGEIQAFGFQALYSNTTGGSNTALGRSTLSLNTTGSSNTAVGYQAAYSNTTASQNTAVGMEALRSNTTGASNTAVGYQAGYSVTSGTTNTFVGNSAGYNVTTGAKNTILGGYNGNQGGLDIRTSSNYIVLSDGDGNPRQVIDSNGSATIGVASLATTATDGFLYVPTCAGTPTGTPTAKTGYAPIVVNTTNNKLYFYSGGAWRDAGP